VKHCSEGVKNWETKFLIKLKKSIIQNDGHNQIIKNFHIVRNHFPNEIDLKIKIKHYNVKHEGVKERVNEVIDKCQSTHG